MKAKARLWILFCLFTSLSACVTPAPAQFGVQPNQLAHIPARIAILPCRKWPQGALYASQKKIEITDAESAALCKSIDTYVFAGFDGQPYMRGLSPDVVKKLLERNQKAALPDQLEQLWFRPSQVCEACRNPTAYYKEVVATRVDWREWLSSISHASASADAVLLPFLAEAQGEVLDDRGLFYATRSAQIVLLLIDTNNGEMIWAGGKKGEIRNPLDKKPSDPKAVVLPTWEELEKRILVPELWSEFPGRQG